MACDSSDVRRLHQSIRHFAVGTRHLVLTMVIDVSGCLLQHLQRTPTSKLTRRQIHYLTTVSVLSIFNP